MAQFTFTQLKIYLSHLLAEYRKMQQQSQTNDAYRIVEIDQKKDGSSLLTIQVVGKNLVFKSKPEELAADDDMIARFSRQDVRTITYFATHEIKQPKYKILMQEFCTAFNKMIFKLKKRGSEEVMQKTAEDISSDPEMIQSLDPKEAHAVGYAAASEKHAEDKQEQERMDDEVNPKYSLEKQDYSETFGQLVHTLKRKGKNETIQKTAAQISEDEKLVKGLSQEDAHRVGYAAGVEKKEEKENN